MSDIITVDLDQALDLIVQTHLSALELEERAIGIMMESGMGVGKSSLFFDYGRYMARILERPFGLVHEFGATLTGPDVRGFMIPIKAKEAGELPQTAFTIPPWYPVHSNTYVFMPDGTMYRRGEYPHAELPDDGALCIDEFGQADDEVQKPMAELLLHATVGTTELPPGWRVLGATNRMSDRSGVMRALMFVVNRRLLLSVKPDLKPWLAWVERQENPPHDMVVTFAEKNPSIVFRDTTPDGTDPFCTPRSLCMAERVLRALRSQEDIDNDKLPLTDLARAGVAGLIGMGAAGQLFAHMRFYDEIPDLEEIEERPRSAKIPTGRDAQMVCCFMMAKRVTEENSSALCTYVSRMDDNMQLLALGVFNNNAEAQKVLLATKEYQQLMFKHKETLRASES